MRHLYNFLLSTLLAVTFHVTRAQQEPTQMAFGFLQGAAHGALIVPESVYTTAQSARKKLQEIINELIRSGYTKRSLIRKSLITEMSYTVGFLMGLGISLGLITRALNNLEKERKISPAIHTILSVAIIIPGLLGALGSFCACGNRFEQNANKNLTV